jgi:ParB/RepB/Spo0J family partition protein
MSTTVLTQTQAPPAIPHSVSARHDKIVQVAIGKLFPSKTNPRTSYDEESLNGLADNIATQGVLQPILARPLGDAFEIVAGHRRVRAAAIVDASASVPVIVRPLSDLEVIEIQNSENEQREDVKPIEQGRGYKAWIDQLAKETPDAKQQDLLALVAKRVGKSVRYVYGRMQLTQLVPELQESLEQGHIDSSHADLLVRLGPQEQKSVFEDYFSTEAREDFGREELPSVRTLKSYIESSFQPLKKAPFKLDADQFGPVCVGCQHNSATDGGDPKKATCSNKECFGAKSKKCVEIQTAALTEKFGRTEVRVCKSNYAAGKGLIKGGDWKTAKPKSCDNVVPAVEVDHNNDQVLKVLTVCTNKKCKTHFTPEAKTKSGSGGVSAEDREKAAQREREEKAAIAGDVALVEAVMARVGTFGKAELSLIVQSVALHAEVGDEGVEAIAKLMKWPVPKEPGYRQLEDWWKKFGKGLSVVEMGRFIIAALICEAIGGDQYYGNCKPEDLDNLALAYKLDAKAIRKQASDAVLKPAAKPEAKEVSQVRRAAAVNSAADGGHPHPTSKTPSSPPKQSTKATTKKPSPKAAKKTAKKGGRK